MSCISHAKPVKRAASEPTLHKPTYWVSMQRWMSLTIEQHRNLDSYCRNMGLELSIDLIGDRCNGVMQTELQKDKNEEREGDWTR
jgi:hypothetical protein